MKWKGYQSQKLHGKTKQPSPTMVTWFNYTKTDINYKYRLGDKEQKTLKKKKPKEILKKHHSIKQT
jgi:hypothetical protein